MVFEEEDAPTEEVDRTNGADALSPAKSASLSMEQRRLHPASVAVNLIPRGWQFVRGAWPWLLALFIGGGGVSAEGAVELSVLLFVLAGTLWSTVVHYFTLRYQVVDGRLEIATGLLNRQVRQISADRIQNLELVRNLFHKMSGLVELHIETASGGEVEGMLSALSVEEGEELVALLDRARGAVARAEEKEPPPSIIENSTNDLFRFGTTQARFGLAMVVLLVMFDGVLPTMNTPEERSSLASFAGVFGAALFVAVMSGAWLAGVAGAMLKHHGFKLVKRGTTLIAEEGLFTRRRVELPLAKVQRVTVLQPFLRRLFGFGSVTVESAAANADGGGTRRSRSMIPVVELARFDEMVALTVPDLDVVLGEVDLLPPHQRQLWRAWIRASVQSGIAAFVVGLVWWPWGLVAWGLVPLNMVLAWLDWRYQGWLVTDRVVVSRRGYLSRTTTIISRSKLQSCDVRQGPLLRRHGLGLLVLRVAGSSVTMPVIGFEQALDIQHRLLRVPGSWFRGVDRCPGVIGHDGNEAHEHHEVQREGDGPDQEEGGGDHPPSGPTCVEHEADG